MQKKKKKNQQVSNTKSDQENQLFFRQMERWGKTHLTQIYKRVKKAQRRSWNICNKGEKGERKQA